MKFLSPEDLQRGLLPGRVTVEGEDHLTVEGVVVAHQPLQHPSMIITEGRPAGGDRGLHPRQVGRHHIGVALDHHGLGLFADRLPCQVEAVEHMRLLVHRRLGVLMYLAGSRSSS